MFFMLEKWKKKKVFFLFFILAGVLFFTFDGTLFADTADVTVTIAVASKTNSNVDTTAVFADTLTNPDNTTLDISLPSNVLSSGEAVDISLASVSEDLITASKPLPSGKLSGGNFYEISFKKAVDKSSVTSFDQAITLTFTYTDADVSGIDESTLKAYRWNGSSWATLSDSVVNASSNTITASSQNFSTFGVFGTAPVESTPAPTTSSGTSGGGGGGGGGGSGGIIAPAVTVTKAIFKGQAYPKSTITLLQDAKIVASTIAGSDSKFEISISNLSAGNYIFSLYGEDSKGLRSSLQTFPISVSSGATTQVSGIFISPTIDVDKSEVKRGDTIIILGQTVPQSDITIVVNSEEEFFGKTIADKDGMYAYNFDTTVLEFGQHSAKSKASVANQSVSNFSYLVNFKVGSKNIAKEKSKSVGKGDLNNDRRVNLIDFSVMAYWYKRPIPPTHIDLNGDKTVNLIDFSIMAFYWTG